MLRLCLTEEQWADAEKIGEILEPFRKYSVLLQSGKCTLSDFYGYWHILRLKVSKQDHELATLISTEMNEREEILLQNPLLLSAVYLDPRYQRGLNDNGKAIAVQYLKNLHFKIKAIEKASVPSDQLNEHSRRSSFDDIESFLDSIQNSDHNRANGTAPSSDEILDALHAFYGVRETARIDVLEYWEKRKVANPQLYELSCTVFAVPPTQTTVERCFSSLPVVITSRRSRLGQDSLENILLLRLNPSILVMVRDRRKRKILFCLEITQ